MRNQLHKKALTRFAVSMSVGAAVPLSALALAGSGALPFAVAAGGLAALVGVAALQGPRRRVTLHRG